MRGRMHAGGCAKWPGFPLGKRPPLLSCSSHTTVRRHMLHAELNELWHPRNGHQRKAHPHTLGDMCGESDPDVAALESSPASPARTAAAST